MRRILEITNNGITKTRRFLGVVETRVIVHVGALGHVIYYGLEFVESHGAARWPVAGLLIAAAVELTAIKEKCEERKKE